MTVTANTFRHADPFTQCEDALWSALESWPGFARLVKAGNRRKLNHEDGQLDMVQEGDLPDVSIEPADGGSLNSHLTNTTSRMVQAFELRVGTSFDQPRRAMFPIKFEIFRAICNAGIKLGLEFVTDTNITDVTDLRRAEQEARGEPGWGLVMRVLITIDINRAILTTKE